MTQSFAGVKLPNDPVDVPRLVSITPSRLETDYIDRDVPVILTGMNRDWPALARWNFDYLRDQAGHIRVPVRGNRYCFRLLGDCSVAEYANWLTGRASNALLEKNRRFSPYIAHSRNIGRTLIDDVDFGRFIPQGYIIRAPTLWIGPAGAETPLHYDRFGVVVYAQIVGRKQVLLFPKQQSSCLYEGGYFDFTTHYSAINLDCIDYAKFPKFAKAIPWVATLEPGDVLVFSRRMWHEFRAVDTGVSVSVHAGTPEEYSDANPALVAQRFLQALHWFGLYKRRDCTCHSLPEGGEWQACIQAASNALAPPLWLASRPKLKRVLTWVAQHNLHRRGLHDVHGWALPRSLEGSSDEV